MSKSPSSTVFECRTAHTRYTQLLTEIKMTRTKAIARLISFICTRIAAVFAWPSLRQDNVAYHSSQQDAAYRQTIEADRQVVDAQDRAHRGLPAGVGDRSVYRNQTWAKESLHQKDQAYRAALFGKL